MTTLDAAFDLACQTLSERIDCPLESSRTIEEEVEIESICSCDECFSAGVPKAVACWRKVLLKVRFIPQDGGDSINRGLERVE